MKRFLSIFLLLSALAWAQTPNLARMLSGVNYQTGTSYAFVPQDATRVVSFNNAGAVAVTISNGRISGFGAGTLFSVVNIGVGTVTITCTGCTINAAPTLALATNQSADLYSDGTNFAAQLSTTGGGGGGGTAVTVNGGAPLASPANLQNGTGTTVTNPSGSNIEVDLNTLGAPGSCTNCNLTLDAQGRATVYGNGSGGGGSSPGGALTQDQYQVNATTFGGKYNSNFNSGTGETDTANLGKEHIVTPVWNYSQTDSAGSIGNLSVAGASKTLTLTCTATVPCVGIDTTNNVNAQYTVYIATVGTPEVVPVTGGSCSLLATANCTIIVTTANVHGAGFTVGSSTQGAQEAYNDASKSGAGIRLKLMPFAGTGNYVFRSTLYLKTNKSILDGYGAQVQCLTRDRCISAGILTGGQIEDVIQGVEFTPGINVDGVNISSVKANTGVYTVTTATAHPFTNSDSIIFYYSTSAQTQESRVIPSANSVHTGASCVNGTAGAGACTTTEFEFTNGSSTFASSAGYGWANIENTAIEDIANHVRLQDIHIVTGGANRFSWGIVVGNDQASVVDGFSLASGTAIKCATSGFCGAGLYYRGDQGASPVAWIANSQISLGCGGGNGIRYAAGNGLNAKDTVVQAFNEYGIYYGGGLQPWTLGPNFYEESGACANFKYPQGGGAIRSQMGYFSGGPKLNLVDNTAIAGNFPSFVAQNVGAQQNNYFIVVKSGGAVASPALYIGKCLTTGVGNCTVYWPEPELDINAGAAITYDLLQVTGTAIVPPYLGNAQSVVTGLTRGANCTLSTGVCSYVDAQAGLSAYSMATQTITTRLSFWPAGTVLSNASLLETAGACGGGSIVTTTYVPTVACATNGATSGTTTGTFSPVFEQTATCGLGSAGGACLRERKTGTGGLKGLFNQIDFDSIPQADLWTTSDSNYQKTLATPNHRPTADAADSAIGFDNAQSAASNLAQMAFRAPVALSNYIGATFDGSSWLERLTASQKTYNVPSTFLQQATALGGAFGFGPYNLTASPTTNCLSGVGGNMTSIAGVFSYASNIATFVSGPAVSVCTAVSTANQSMQIQTVTVGAGSQGVVLRGTNTPGNYTRYQVHISAGAWFIQKCSAVNVCSNLATGAGTFVNGAHFLTGFVSGTTTSTISGYYDGVLLGTASDASTPITSGYPGIEISGIGAVGNAIAISQAYTSNADLANNGSLTQVGNLILSSKNTAEDTYTDLNKVVQSGVGVCRAAAKASGDICTDIQACYAGTMGPGVTSTSAGIIDARDYPVRSNQVCNSNPFAGGNRGGLLLLGNYNIYTSKSIITPQKKMRIVGVGQGSPLGTNGKTTSAENTEIHPCTGVNTPVTGCTASIQQASNKLFVEPTYSATGTEAGNTVTLTTSTAHNYTFTTATPPAQRSHVIVTGCNVAGYNSGGANPAYFQVLSGTTGSTIKYTSATAAMGNATGCTVTEPARQHGRFSATGSGLTNAGDYYALIAMGGQLNAAGYDGLDTCGTGPVGANWTLSAFGSTLEHLSISNDGVAGLQSVYSGNIQERGGFKDVTFQNYGGLLAGNAEESAIMFDRNSWNLNDACSNTSGNGGPSHFIIDHIFCDASPVSNPAGPGASDQSGVCVQLAGNHAESDGTSVEDGGGVGGLAQYGVTGGGTIRGLNDVGKGKSNYGIWAENYDDGSVVGYHFENIFHDPFYLHGINGWTSKGWHLGDLDFASSSGINNAVMHLDTGTDSNIGINLRGASGSTPAAVRDEVNGCGAAFGAAAPCIINGLTDGNPMSVYVQGLMNVYNGIFWGKQASGSNPSTTSGTGAPSAACVSGSSWLRTDGAINDYDCVNSVWVQRPEYDASGNLSIPGNLTVATPGGGVGSQIFLTSEGTAPTGTVTAGQDNCYADSTAHGILCSFNGRPSQPAALGGTVQLTSQYTNSTTGFTNVTGGNNLAIAVAANANYTGTCRLYYQAAATGGLNIEFTGPASPTNIIYSLLDIGSATTIVNASVATAYSTSLGAVVTTATTNFPATVTFSLQNGANAGTLQLLAKSSASVQLQIQNGSFCTWTAQ